MSVLQDMTKGILDTKATKAAKLTPVAGETTTTVAQMAAGIPDIPQVFLTNEAVADVAKDLRRQAALLIEVADGLDILTATKTAVAPPDTTVEDTKAAEKAADEKARTTGAGTVLTPEAQKLVDHMTELQASAQSATFASLDAGAEEPSQPMGNESSADTGVAPTGWVCPDHGGTVQQLTSRKGRVYMACTECDQFEK